MTFFIAVLLLLASPIVSFDNATAGENGKGSAGKSSNRKFIIRSALTAGAGAALFIFDGELNELSQKPRLHGSAADRFFDIVENFGREPGVMISVPAFIGYGLIAKNEKSLRTGGELAGVILGGQGITWAVKRTFGRKRPFESDSPYRFFDGGSSFYSGHTITAFTISAIISINYPRQNLAFLGIDREAPLVPIALYSLAGLVGLQRLYSDAHWASDVYAGALAGYGAGRLAVYFGKKLDIGFLTVVRGGAPIVAVSLRFD